MSHPHAVRREHTLGSLQPVTRPGATMMVTAPASTTGPRSSGLPGHPLRWRHRHQIPVGGAPTTAAIRSDPAGLS
ncbi:MAG TPA: hypothetical protein VIR27_17535 [Mycobacteriales bacterium]